MNKHGTLQSRHLCGYLSSNSTRTSSLRLWSMNGFPHRRSGPLSEQKPKAQCPDIRQGNNWLQEDKVQKCWSNAYLSIGRIDGQP